MKDLHSNIAVVNAIVPGTYKTSTDPTSVTVDRAGYEAVVLVLATAAVTDAQTLNVQHSDDGSTWADVAATDVNGDLSAFEAVAATEDSTTAKLGYIGGKRYVRVASTGAGSTGAIYGVTAILGEPLRAPVA